MKTKSLMVCMATSLLALAACSDEETGNGNMATGIDGDLATVNFEMKANISSYASSTRAIPVNINESGFRVLAFKKADIGNEYTYTGDVILTNPQYSGNILKGTGRLPIGVYKFIPMYGVTEDGSFQGFSLTPNTTKLNETFSINHTNVDGTSAVFLENRKTDTIPAYTLGLTTSNNITVSSKLKRAVSRVDVLFLQATKDANGNYTEIEESKDVFGGITPTSVVMKFKGLNQTVNIAGEDTLLTVGSSTFNKDFVVTDTKAITLGKGTTTKVGNPGFINYDGITPTDIRNNSAHVQGAYLLPFNDKNGHVSLELLVNRPSGASRPIKINKLLPVEKNKVTIVRVYVLSGSVFDTNVDFGVTIDTAWDGSNRVDAEVN